METVRTTTGAVDHRRIRMAHALLPYRREEQSPDRCHHRPQAAARGRGRGMHRLRLPSGPEPVAGDVLHLRCPSGRAPGLHHGHRGMRVDRDGAYRALGGSLSHPPHRGAVQRRSGSRGPGPPVQPPSQHRNVAGVPPSPAGPPLSAAQHGRSRTLAGDCSRGRFRRPLPRVEEHICRHPHCHTDHRICYR